jgi:hypothetical protein
MPIHLLLLAAFLSWQASPQRPPQMKLVTTAEVAAVVEAKERGWDFVPGVCTCPPLVIGQKSQSVGSWERDAGDGERETILMDIYQIASAEEASAWLKGFERKTLGATCQTTKYPLGDEAYQLECPLSPRDTIKVNKAIFLRRRNYLIEVRGGEPETVERFAKYALAQLPAS